MFSKINPKNFIETDPTFEGYDPVQVKMMNELCIIVDDQDKNIGNESKKACHLIANIDKGMLHRAFSVFLFNSKNQLLLQQRSETKITFPGMFTNTCCGHPLSFDLEMEENDAIGIKRAAQRKLFNELGITPDQIPLSVFHFITRIRYRADNIPRDGKFGENEIDYVLFVKKDVDIVCNPHEVKGYQFIDQNKLKELLKSNNAGNMLTPWFRLICDRFLFHWWNNLGNLKSVQDHSTIHHLK